MRLRLRFFLISWPLVLLAVAAVAFGVERWTVVELQRIERGQRPLREVANEIALVSSVAEAWERAGAAPSRAELTRLAEATGLARSIGAQIVLDSVGRLLITTEPALHLLSRPLTVGGVAEFALRTRGGLGDETESVLAFSGAPVRTASGRVLGALYLIPKAREGSAGAPVESRRTALRRRIWSVAAVASLAAAAAALLLAGPLVARVRGLADAAAAIRRGALDTRVSENGSDELSEFAASFNAMTRALAESRAHQRKLIVDVAHELRTPLTNVVGIVEAMQDGLRARDDATLVIARREVGFLMSLVHELQELSLAESGAIKFDITDVDIGQLARDAVAAITPTSSGQLVIAPVETVSVYARADARRLSQCLGNLLQNALTHTPPDGRVQVLVERSGSAVTCAVSDTGVGIPAPHLAHVFDRFYRVDPSRARSSGGMGLGLALVRELVTGMGGRVWVESEVGKGSRFVIELTGSPTPTDAT